MECYLPRNTFASSAKVPCIIVTSVNIIEMRMDIEMYYVVMDVVSTVLNMAIEAGNVQSQRCVEMNVMIIESTHQLHAIVWLNIIQLFNYKFVYIGFLEHRYTGKTSPVVYGVMACYFSCLWGW